VKIKTARIEHPSDKLFGGPSKAVGVMEDGTEEPLFRFYSDELSFTTGELEGLTAQEARALHHRKDVGYIRS